MAKIAVEGIELAWAAGLFDGEGCVAANTRGNGYTAITMAVAMCDQEAVERFARAVGVGSVLRLKRPTLKGKTVWRWSANADETVGIAIERLRPYLSSTKLEDAERALEKRAGAKAQLTYGRKAVA